MKRLRDNVFDFWHGSVIMKELRLQKRPVIQKDPQWKFHKILQFCFQLSEQVRGHTVITHFLKIPQFIWTKLERRNVQTSGCTPNEGFGVQDGTLQRSSL